ncbi:Uncharacterized conserved protein, contains HEPN domain [Algoriphagus locisalis]|uniref:Uncharacterized conserved protein, contains HEPN domain n=1 Tax=Algoriphagus locisalis TaxID=305507 RepID=A0A1I7CGB1_9BACT|nr:DUF86 domain-containing protein [Algoriphagus locisalis]SFT98490.1 Uncharacterized conserved protein, contains HEPN domain [Algoriphagus locisalis]
MNAKDLKYILDIQSIIEELEIIKNRVSNNFINYKNDFIVKRAVERDLEIIGEAVRKLTEQNPNMALSSIKKIIGLRNMISHAYDSIDNELIWAIIQKDIPILNDKIKKLRDN